MEPHHKVNQTLGWAKGQKFTEVVFTDEEKEEALDDWLRRATKNNTLMNVTEYEYAEPEFPDSILLKGHVDERFVLGAIELHKKFARIWQHQEEIKPRSEYL